MCDPWISVNFVLFHQCYNSFEVGLNPNVTAIRESWVEYLDNILASGHGSVLEHASWTFAIEGVSRVFTGEMNRHRAGCAISEASMRYIRMSDMGFWMPLSLLPCEGDSEELLEKKKESRRIFQDVFKGIEHFYSHLESVWGINDPGIAFSEKKKLTSMFRRIVPMGVATGGVWTMNLRALRHVLAMRMSPAAEEEIHLVAGMILKVMQAEEPVIFGDFILGQPKYVKV